MECGREALDRSRDVVSHEISRASDARARDASRGAPGLGSAKALPASLYRPRVTAADRASAQPLLQGIASGRQSPGATREGAHVVTPSTTNAQALAIKTNHAATT